MQTAMALLLLISALLLVRSLLRRTADQRSAINVEDLLLEWDPGTKRLRMSVLRVVFLGAFIFTIWLLVFLALKGKMTEGYLGIFNFAWVAPLVAAIIWGKKPPLLAGPPQQETTVTTETKVKTDAPAAPEQP